MARPLLLLQVVVFLCSLQQWKQVRARYFNAYPDVFSADVEVVKEDRYGDDDEQFTPPPNAWSEYYSQDDAALLQSDSNFDNEAGEERTDEDDFDVSLAGGDEDDGVKDKDEDDGDEEKKSKPKLIKPKPKSTKPKPKSIKPKPKPTNPKEKKKKNPENPKREEGAGGEQPLPTEQRSVGGCGLTGNPVDDCWRCDTAWSEHRQGLAACAIGFGRDAGGGKNGRLYVVTSNGDDNPANPAPGTLRHAVTQLEPLWVVFAGSMVIKLKNELVIASFKTIDGRGATVRIAGGGGLRVERVQNVIIHNLFIYDIVATGPGNVMSSPGRVKKRNRCDGDAISVYGARNVWIDHCYLSTAEDGLIDVTKGSTAVSITNNYFTKHNKVILLGASNKDEMDRMMEVTVAYNKFGPELQQRMPRVRFGSCHVVNNDYSSGWGIYAIGGSQAPVILSEGNAFNAGNSKKQVTSRIDDGGPQFGGPLNWEWKSEGDAFLNGAYFSGIAMKWSVQSYSRASSCSARPASMVQQMVRDAGPLVCVPGERCS